ncbi:hypothetical protein BGX24_012815 [Mortierella sp. AD032]|nr:hypothetical protein BGX24_012815 [Mortierella sp. AD032]
MGRKGGRSLNPADQYRKEQHKKEVKKNRQDRKKVRELGSVLKDTTTESDLAEHEELEKQGKLDNEGVKKLEELRERMAKIIEVKQAHGIKIKLKKVEAPKPVPVAEPVRDPTRSIYYDPVMNPYGAPPPGQPYLEYPPLPQEVPLGQGGAPGLDQQQQQQPGDASDSDSAGSDSDSNSDSDSDSDSDSSSGSESEDENNDNYMPPLPNGPTPSREDQSRYLELTKAKPIIDTRILHHQRPQFQGMQPPGMFPPGMHPADDLSHIMGKYTRQDHQDQDQDQDLDHRVLDHRVLDHQVLDHQVLDHQSLDHQRPPPRYVKSPRTSDPQSDPMTGHLPPDEKDKKNQAVNKESSTPAAPHPLPPKPTIGQGPSKPAIVAGPTSISAEPQLRNLQKELVHLVPSAIMRKRVTQKGKIGRPVNAAPGIEEDYQSASPPTSTSSTTTTMAAKFTSQGSQGSSETMRESGNEEHRETALGLRLPKINLTSSVPSFLSSTRMVINSAPEVPAAPVDKAAKKKAEYDEFMQGLEGDGLL